MHVWFQVDPPSLLPYAPRTPKGQFMSLAPAINCIEFWEFTAIAGLFAAKGPGEACTLGNRQKSDEHRRKSKFAVSETASRDFESPAAGFQFCGLITTCPAELAVTRGMVAVSRKTHIALFDAHRPRTDIRHPNRQGHYKRFTTGVSMQKGQPERVLAACCLRFASVFDANLGQHTPALSPGYRQKSRAGAWATGPSTA
jgi:hypothetical protein